MFLRYQSTIHPLRIGPGSRVMPAPESVFCAGRQAIPYQDRIPAVGLSSTELGNPNIAYKDVYAAAIDAGFIPVAHAGALVDSTID